MATFSVLVSPSPILTATDMNQMILLELEIFSFCDGSYVTVFFLQNLKFEHCQFQVLFVSLLDVPGI